MIEAKGQLVAAYRLGRNGFDGIAPGAGVGTNCRRSTAVGSMQASGIGCSGKILIRECRPESALRRFTAASHPGRLFRTDPSVSVPPKGSETGKIGKGLGRAGTLLRRGDSHYRRRYALPDAATFIGHKEEGFIFLNRSAKGSAELVLVKLRLGRIESSPLAFSTLLRKNS